MLHVISQHQLLRVGIQLHLKVDRIWNPIALAANVLCLDFGQFC